MMMLALLLMSAALSAAMTRDGRAPDGGARPTPQSIYRRGLAHVDARGGVGYDTPSRDILTLR